MSLDYYNDNEYCYSNDNRKWNGKGKKKLNRRIRIGNTVWVRFSKERDKSNLISGYEGPGVIIDLLPVLNGKGIKVKLPINVKKSSYKSNEVWLRKRNIKRKMK
ncbi:MAG: hypothetical protein HOG49_36605 [Candidatus Scalindua sp.]|mgnify:FL=1|jgi:hypothetical protein|nr:hypothetical protein [Candidatus Scalindua sp.]